MENVWAYLRRSRDEEGDPHLLSKHRSELLRLAAADGITIPPENILEEIGSADQIESRPVFRALLSVWERLPRAAGGVIYSTEVSRLTRGLQSQQGRVQDALIRAGLRHRTRSRWYDLSLPDDCTAWELEAFVARLEYRLLKARAAAAFAEMLRAGRVRNGKAPYGYRWSKEEENVLPVPDRFELLVRCCREVHTTSVKGLVRRYGIPESTLLHALRNPLICGFPCRRFAPRDPDAGGKKQWVLLPRSEWDWPEAANEDYPHACTRAEWEAIQQVIDARRLRHSFPDYREGWCRDLVWFPQNPGLCHLGVYTFPHGGGRILTYERRVGRGKALYVARELIHQATYDCLLEFFGRPGWLKRSLKKQAEEAVTLPGPEAREMQVREALRQLAATRKRYQEAVDAEMDADDANHRQALSQRRGRLQAELGRHEADLQALQARPEPQIEFLRALVQLPSVAQDFPGFWAAADGERRARIAAGVLKRIEVTVTPRPRSHKREVTAIEWQPWAQT